MRQIQASLFIEIIVSFATLRTFVKNNFLIHILGLRPVKPEKQKKVANQTTMQVQEPMYFTPITQSIIQQQQPQPVMVYTGTGQEQVTLSSSKVSFK